MSDRAHVVAAIENFRQQLQDKDTLDNADALLSTVFKYDLTLRTQRTQELDHYRQATHTLAHSNDLNVEPEQLQTIVIDCIKNDLAKIQVLDQSVKDFIENNKRSLSNYLSPWRWNKMQAARYLSPLRSNKMQATLQATLTFAQTDFELFYDAIIMNMQTKLADNRYHTAPNEVILLNGNEDIIYGNHKFPRFTGLLSNIYLALAKHLEYKNPSILTPIISQGIDNSTLFHVMTLPEANMLSQDSAYFFNDVTTPHGLCTIASGYEFGGHVFDRRYSSTGKWFGPEDCSSFIGASLGLYKNGNPIWDNKIPLFSQEASLSRMNKNQRLLISTCDLYFHYLRDSLKRYPIVLEPKETSRKYQAWASGSSATYLENMISVLQVRDPQRDLKPGDIYCLRRKVKELGNNVFELGSSGHCGMLFSTPTASGDTTTYECNRDIETNTLPQDTKGGAGFDYKNLFNTQDPNIMTFFRLHEDIRVNQPSIVRALSFR